LLFASHINDEDRLEALMKANVPVEKLHFSNNQEHMKLDGSKLEEGDMTEFTRRSLMYEFIDNIGEKILLTKKECSLIEVRTGPTGTQTFDLPPNLKNKHKDINRVRRDSYTA